MKNILNIPGKLNAVALFVLTVFSANSFAENVYTFSDSFIRGKHIKADLSKYTDSGILEGIYSLDVYTNGEWKGRYDLNVAKQPNGDIGICYDKSMLTRFGLSPERLNDALARKEVFCGALKVWNADVNVTDTISKETMRLDISIPQIYQDQMYRGYIDPSMWDTGISALNVGWNGNIWNSHYSSMGSTDSTTGYLGINALASMAGWSLSHTGTMSWSDKTSVKWESSRTSLKRPVPEIKTLVSVGQVSGTGEFFDTVTVRGINLKTDDSMYPDGVTNFAPEIRGEARTNALVTVRQNGNIIHQVTVSPGPFILKDVYPSGYGSNLDVSVKESDGSITYFVVPYNSVTRLIRPGMFRYEITAGKPDDAYLTVKPVVYQATMQYGFNNILTGYTGFSGYDKYQSYLLGMGINTSVGGFSLDTTVSKLKVNAKTETGRMYRGTYFRSFEETGTSVSLTAIKYANEGFYNLNNALIANQYTGWNRWNEKSNLSFSINQSLPDKWGSFYATVRQVDYWNETKKDKQYQVSYSNNFGKLSYSLSAQKAMYYSAGRHTSDNRVSLNFSLPLDFGDGYRTSLSSHTAINNSRYSNTQVGVSGSLGERDDISYGVNTSVGDSKELSLNAGYRSTWASLNGSFAQGSDYRQASVSGSGSFVVHDEGVTFTPETGETLALVKAKGAKGARISSSLGSRVDGDGFAIVSTVRPYRVNSIELDPKGAADNVYFSETMKQVVPYQGSVVKVTFDTEIQDNIMLKGKMANGKPLPFGAIIYNVSGKEIGTVGQGGVAYITNASLSKAIIKMENGSCSFIVSKNQKGDVLCD